MLVDRDQLLRNLGRVQRIAAQHDVALRPHVKTHKCIEIARLQLEHGAVGLTASKVDEALVFIEQACGPSFTLAYPIVDPRKLQRAFASAGHQNVELRITVDSEAGIAAAEAAAKSCNKTVSAFVKIDVGLHRCGLVEDDPQVVRLVRLISSSSQLRFAGLLSHAGQAYTAPDIARIAEIAAEESAILQRVRSRLASAGFDVPEVSVGSTPTVLAGNSFEAVTEIRPGNYVFLDATAVRLGLASFEEVALSVVVTIISANSSYFIIDGGSKVLSSDLGAHGTGAGVGYGVALPIDVAGAEAAPLLVARLSEEHGFVERAGEDLAIGTKLRVIPNHACPVANLAERLTITSQGEMIDQWQVAARGKVR